MVEVVVICQDLLPLLLMEVVGMVVEDTTRPMRNSTVHPLRNQCTIHQDRDQSHSDRRHSMFQNRLMEVDWEEELGVESRSWNMFIITFTTRRPAREELE